MRFFLFDRILEVERNKSLVATKLVDVMDEYLSDHFQRQPVMPATLIMEALAQASGMLNNLNHDFAVEMVLMLVDGVHILHPVYPGDLITLKVQMVYDHPYGATMRGEARVDSRVVATIDRIVFAHEVTRDPARIQENRERFAYQSGSSLYNEE